ncbi:MAG: RNA-dependent RNA polymerase [Hangzhou tipula scripta rhabdovirus 1]|nr:MAG: RNA-dependent RNA polymerase [Hangzhou tipula scripta rhabdovirus 1]
MSYLDPTFHHNLLDSQSDTLSRESDISSLYSLDEDQFLGEINSRARRLNRYKKDESIQFLHQHDYTLNSPLLVDQTQALIDFLKSGVKVPLYYQLNWEVKKTLLKSYLKGKSCNPIPLSNYHNVLRQIWQDDSKNNSRFCELLRQTDQHAFRTFEVIKAYIKGWLEKEINFKPLNRIPREISKYGELMLDGLILTWLINANSLYEIDSLIKTFNCQYHDTKNKKEGIIYKSEAIGEVFILHGYIYLKKFNMLWDRNMLLNFKDTAAGRFNTLFNIYHKHSELYSENHYYLINRLYTLGDQMFQHDTQTSFEAIGLVEGITSLRLSELAAKHRPEIPVFDHFRKHIIAKSEELNRMNPNVTEFVKFMDNIDDKRVLLTMYGTFRHWGHPFIDYLTGLNALYKNVTSTDIEINEDYAETLASDLAFKVLRKEFRSSYKWFVNKALVDINNPLHKYISSNTWPAMDVLVNYPAEWHKLPLTACWKIPEVVDPSILYSDKSHSITKSELKIHLLTKPNKPIPTRKVLDTMIRTPTTNWPSFLKQINEFGLEEDDLIIGLKGKEREIKWKGRFFALMSWKLREYFVFTEYLIKKNILPLFTGLTMADDQTTLIKKMLKNSCGQGGKDYKHITIANHIDYEKWNNFQRMESTGPVFRVMGQFHGLPNLFFRTHQFFKDSLIYYRDRPDLLTVKDGMIVNRDPKIRVCWTGQLGGLEGLRQKGWSVLNLLVIERESRIRNTQVKILAQGDNQVICTMYQVENSDDPVLRKDNIASIIKNNDVIIQSIRDATFSIGLKINEDETLQATDLLLYGKVIVYRGNFTCLEEKRYSRITCTTNDQLPNLGNTMSTVSTNCLTVAHYSKSPIEPILHYHWMGNFVINLLSLHNPAIHSSLKLHPNLRNIDLDSNLPLRIKLLYLDPSLGGVSGMALTRFHIRMFPDPITEGLHFWKTVYLNTNDNLVKMTCVDAGNPNIVDYKVQHFTRLLEDPTALNLPRGLSAKSLIKDHIKEQLLSQLDKVANRVIQECLSYIRDYELGFIEYLSKINPCFPRFLSEFKSSTFFGITDGILSLFENSRTLRNMFRAEFPLLIDQTIQDCEVFNFVELSKRPVKEKTIWRCGSSHADYLRENSWKRKIIGTTVPYPGELLKPGRKVGHNCGLCQLGTPMSVAIIVLIPNGIEDPDNSRGPYQPYLGSSTKETTSLIQSWEKDTDVSFLYRASRLRRAMNWFVKEGSNLSESIYNNLRGLTGEEPGKCLKGFQRSGSALHRFGCSRVSAGGYIANNTVYASRMCISSDMFKLLGEQNYDFMYQSLMLYSQQTAGELHQESRSPRTYHLHIDCIECLRPIEEPIIDSGGIYQFPAMNHILAHWKPEDTKWFDDDPTFDLIIGDWDILNREKMSFIIGETQGVLFGCLHDCYKNTSFLNDLFPNTLKNKIKGFEYLTGLVGGLYRAAAMEATHRRVYYLERDPKVVIKACYYRLVEQISNYPDFINFLNNDSTLRVLQSMKHRIPPSYPLSAMDLSLLSKSFLNSFTYDEWKIQLQRDKLILWIFADTIAIELSGILIMCFLLSDLIRSNAGIERFKNETMQITEWYSIIREQMITLDLKQLIQNRRDIWLCQSEIRHAMKNILDNPEEIDSEHDCMKFTNRIKGKNYIYRIYTSTDQTLMNITHPYEIPRILNPTISGIRLPQIATGAFLKIELLLANKGKVTDILCGGDGSGGISAALLRKYPKSRLIFNSLLKLEGVDLHGCLPGPPTALQCMSKSVRERCVNLNNVWERPTDLSKEETWIGFLELKQKYDLRIDLMLFDMEVVDNDMSSAIETWLIKFIPILLESNGTLIYKTYCDRILNHSDNFMYNIANFFKFIQVAQNDMSSSHTSEIYLMCFSLNLGHYIKVYPNMDRLSSDLKKTFVHHKISDEFFRAQEVLKIDLLKGIPEHLIPDPINELMGIWCQFGKNYYPYEAWSSILRQELKGSRHKISCADLALGSLVVVSNQVLNTTRWNVNSEVFVPSTMILKKFFGYYLGTLLYISLVNNAIDLYIKTIKAINTDFLVLFSNEEKVVQVKSDYWLASEHIVFSSHDPIYTQKEPTQGENKQDLVMKTVYGNKWTILSDVYSPKSVVKEKAVSVLDQSALMGATIRYWLMLGNQSGKLGSKRLWTSLVFMNKNLTKGHVLTNTGVLDLLENYLS